MYFCTDSNHCHIWFQLIKYIQIIVDKWSHDTSNEKSVHWRSKCYLICGTVGVTEYRDLCDDFSTAFVLFFPKKVAVGLNSEKKIRYFCIVHFVIMWLSFQSAIQVRRNKRNSAEKWTRIANKTGVKNWLWVDLFHNIVILLHSTVLDLCVLM